MWFLLFNVGAMLYSILGGALQRDVVYLDSFGLAIALFKLLRPASWLESIAKGPPRIAALIFLRMPLGSNRIHRRGEELLRDFTAGAKGKAQAG